MYHFLKFVITHVACRYTEMMDMLKGGGGGNIEGLDYIIGLFFRRGSMYSM